jgi:hypothetical protein
MIADSFFLTTTGAIVAIVVGAAITGGIGFMITSMRHLVKKIDTASDDTHEVRDAVAGRTPTPLEPSPPPGLISISTGHTQAILATSEQVKKMADHQLAQNGKVDRIETMVRGQGDLIREIVATELTTDTARTIAADSVAQADTENTARVLAASNVALVAHANKEEILDAIAGHEHE